MISLFKFNPLGLTVSRVVIQQAFLSRSRCLISHYLIGLSTFSVPKNLKSIGFRIMVISAMPSHTGNIAIIRVTMLFKCSRIVILIFYVLQSIYVLLHHENSIVYITRVVLQLINCLIVYTLLFVVSLNSLHGMAN